MCSFWLADALAHIGEVEQAQRRFERLLSFPNVIVTGHQAFCTREAITTICETTINSFSEFAAGKVLPNEIRRS